MVEEKNLDVQALPVMGRSQARLSQAVAVSIWMRDFATREKEALSSLEGPVSTQEAVPR